jgi:quercetin dioxygenase-like cupin family protein
VEAQAVALDGRPWDDEAPGIRSRSSTVDGARWAVVEYAPGARREEWCTDGHRGFVLAGAIRYEFDDGAEAIEARAGQAFLLPAGQGHRGTNLDGGVTALFLIDDAP